MATKTLSIDEAAYRILARARREAKESFSQVIKRASWDSGEPRCGRLLSRTRGLPLLSDGDLERLEEGHHFSRIPDLAVQSY